MNFVPSEEHEELRRSLRRFLEDRSPPAEVRRLTETADGYDGRVWREMAGDLGLQGLTLPEAHGGSGYGPVEGAVVFEEMGRALLCAPFFSTVALAANAVCSSGDRAAMADLLPGVASGETVATLALTEAGGGWEPDEVTVRATPTGGGGHILDGEKSFVTDGQVAHLVLVVARSGTPPRAGADGISLFAVDGDAPGLTRTALPTLDQTRRQARLGLAATPGRLVGEEGRAWPGLSRALALAATALAAEQVGVAQRCLEMSVGHARTRVQFGRPIGSFQAVKHKCADMLVQVEHARSAAAYAAWVAAGGADEADGGDDLAVVAPLAEAYCADACFAVAEETIHVHGGLGFTWEHDAHLYFKRAASSRVLLGPPSHHRELVARGIGL